jgi:hypothetical protein
MATLPETATWEDGIYQLEETDPVQGGLNGIDNLQGKQLANRTAYLKKQVDTANTGLANHIAAADPHPQYTTAAELETRIAALIASAPAALDTLNELASALGDDPNFATTITKALAAKAPLASPALTGTPTAPTAAAGTSTTQLATTAFVTASPVFTGTPTAPTAAAGTNNTQLATTAYVDGKMVLRTAVASTSGTSIDFTGIPAWVKRITVMFNGVSTNGTSNFFVQLGTSAGITTSGYVSGVVTSGGSASSTTGTSSTSGIIITRVASADGVLTGMCVLANIGSNTYVSNGICVRQDAPTVMETGAAGISLSKPLTTIRITTGNGTDTFDAGSINIMYEG